MYTFRRLNDKNYRFERSFVDPNGLPDRLQYRHVVFAPRYHYPFQLLANILFSSSNSYASAAFPAVYDSMYNIDWSDNAAAENVKEQFATLSFFIYNAAHNLDLNII